MNLFRILLIMMIISVAAACSSQSTSKVEDLENELLEYEEKVASLLEEKEDLKLQIERLNNEKEQLQQDLEENDNRLIELEDQLQQHQSTIEEKLGAIEGYEKQVEQLKNQVNELKSQNNELNKRNQQLENEIKELKKQLEAKKTPSVKPIPPKEDSRSATKKVFLTFDDGPTTLTPKVFDVLKENQVPATFFMIGQRMEQHPQLVKRAYQDSHMVLTHSYSHDYSIYTSFDTYYNDLTKVEATYKRILGFDAPSIIRFPGGSSNHSSFQYGGKEFMPKLTEDIKKKGYYYIDWNVSSGDAGTAVNNADKIYENVVTNARNKDFIVVLFHDVSTNGQLVKALPDIIKYLKMKAMHFEVSVMLPKKN
ncbi:polysaccharide deacetylase family protein [Alkalihalobacterium chitinilyticum]|uniref:Polysaccharide deacetylase family protein n=1 Tax=Alkalihalobacterium chitinilyticum TaxID=2980103 RepID=A0ABT5VDP6_9BACI|nr:polysaccharide deacetylase family protein [Alkalihalobacterium chitinilyticum]MDE5413568.1 polysaccharide deacetylase family protein [Alkalihalobacterium chitinilyticum]